ncbi:hypothetical protein AADZ90_003465 [Aestuariibius sp. 2305UL40-4]|uniref:hypothetical protein n=1 Tax=Aestuariibius violaceus TaxID=3234132 RepID=UPI0034829D69
MPVSMGTFLGYHSPMRCAVLRPLLVLSLVLGLLVPKMGVVLVELIPGWQTMVICTGGEMVVMTISPEGEPVEVEQDGAEPCPPANVIADAEQDIPRWVYLARDYGDQAIHRPSLRRDLSVILIRGPTRAPPLPI